MGKGCVGRVAVVTGARRGIGRGIALRLASEGADVALVNRESGTRRFERTLGDTLDEVRAMGRRAIAIEADLADPAVDRAAVVDEVESALGPVDILVNNAASIGFKSMTDWSPDELRAAQEVNVWAPWELIRRVLPGMLERDRGWIVNITSGASEMTNPGFAAYAGTKAMLNRITRVLVTELADTQVAAYLLAPRGTAETELQRQLVGEGVLEQDLGEPLSGMAEAVVALVTIPKGTLPDGMPPSAAPGEVGNGTPDTVSYRSLDLVAAVNRPVLDLRGERVIVGYSAGEVTQRIAEIAQAATRLGDLQSIDNS